MLHRIFFAMCVLLAVCMSLSQAVSAQSPQPPQPSLPIEPAIVLPPAVPLGQVGVSYRYAQTFGISMEPYTVEGQAYLNLPSGLTMDSANNLYVVEEMGARVIGYDSSKNQFMTIGKTGVFGIDQYRLSPRDLALDGNGDLWVVDPCRIIQYKLPGTFVQSYPAEENNPWECGPGNDRFGELDSIAFDDNSPIQYMFLSESNNQRVQVFKIDLNAAVLTPPVYVTTIGVTGEAGSNALHFDDPNGVSVDSQNRVYVVDQNNNRVQRCRATNTGVGDRWNTWECETFLDKFANQTLSGPRGVFVGASDDVFILDSLNARILKWDTSDSAFSALITDFPGYPMDITQDTGGNVYISDASHVVWKYNSAGTNPVVFAGTLNTPYITTAPRINTPWGVTAGPDGSLYVGEDRGKRLVKFNPNGTQSWAFGVPGVYGDSNSRMGYYWGGVNGNPALDITGTKLYVPDTANARVITLNAATGAFITTIGSWGSGDYEFDQTRGVAVSPVNGDIFVTDHVNHRVQVYSKDWGYKTTIGVTGVPGSDLSHLRYPYGVAVASNGAVYIPDADNNRVLKCTSANGIDYTCAHFAGTTGQWGREYNYIRPMSVAVSGTNLVFVGDSWNSRVMVYDGEGKYLTSLAGEWGESNGQMRNPNGVTVDPQGNLYVTDSDNARVQKFAPGVPGWKQVNHNGFGDPTTAAATLQEFNGYLYSAAASWDKSLRIWRSPDGVTWSPVNSFNEGIGENHAAVISMTVYKGFLYAGTGWNDSNASIWRTADGTTWTPVVSAFFGDPYRQAVDVLIPFKDNLYAAVSHETDDGGVAIYRSPSGAIDTWNMVISGGNGNASNNLITGMAEFDGVLYAVGKNSEEGSFVWRSSADGSTWTQVNTYDFGVGDMEGTSIVVFKGSLYVGTFLPGGPCHLWRTTNGTTWTQAVTPGFGNPGVDRVGALIASNGTLSAVVNTVESGMVVWQTSDGVTWAQASIPGFGDGNNIWSMRSNALVYYKSHLHIALGNPGNGVEIWKQVSSYLYLPAVRR